MVNEERLSRKEFTNYGECPLYFIGGEIMSDYDIKEVIKDLNELLGRGYTHVRLNSEYDTWLELKGLVFIYETDEEMEARISKEMTEEELAVIEKENRNEVLARLTYEKLKLKFEGK